MVQSTQVMFCYKKHELKFDFEDFFDAAGRWQVCPLCRATDAFVCKKVPRKTLLITLIPMLVLALFLMEKNWVIGVSILVGLAVADALLFVFLPDMLVCYGCQSEFDKIPEFKKTDYKYFDHHTAEKYRRRSLAKENT